MYTHSNTHEFERFFNSKVFFIILSTMAGLAIEHRGR